MDLTISGVNVHIVSGSGSTSDGTVDRYDHRISGKKLTGLGNLIIGYNEPNELFVQTRTGSHNLIVGSANDYRSYGGLIVGSYNASTAPYASVNGGWGNLANAKNAVVSGGWSNTAKGAYSSVSGGSENRANFDCSSVSGGWNNTANFANTSVSGGCGNTASGFCASVSGGRNNTARGWESSVSGGQDNKANGYLASSVSGGMAIIENFDYGWSVGRYHSPVHSVYDPTDLPLHYLPNRRARPQTERIHK